MPQKNNRLRIMAGPNGSGKSTVLKEVRNKFYSGPFVNADDIEKSFHERKLVNLLAEYDLDVADKEFELFVKGPGESWVQKAEIENSKISVESSNGILVVKDTPSLYDAALAADYVRYQLLMKNETFTFETVLSHPSKIDFLQKSKATGYKNYLYFICTVSPVINIDRIKQRVKLGGHNVPEEKISKRYFESLLVLPQIIPLCYRVYFFDNSEEKSIEPVAEIDTAGNLIIHQNDIPWWLQAYVIDPLYNSGL